MTWNCATLRRAIFAAGAMMFLCPTIAAAQIIIAGVYFSSLDKACGSSVLVCDNILDPVPAGRILFLDRVTCSIKAPSTAKITQLSIRRVTPDLNVSFQFLAPLTVMSTDAGETVYHLNADANLAVKAGERPTIRIAFSTATAFPKLNCSVHGLAKVI